MTWLFNVAYVAIDGTLGANAMVATMQYPSISYLQTSALLLDRTIWLCYHQLVKNYDSAGTG